jgi:hypothetical protein
MAAQGAGAVIGGVGAIMQAQAQASALDRAADIQRRNAQLDIQTGEANAAISAMNSNKKIGGIAAGYGAAGIAQDSGSVLAVMAGSASNAELDRQNIIHGYKVRAINYENQASMDEAGAKSAMQGGYLNAFASLVQGGTKAYSNSAGVAPGQYTPIRHGSDNGLSPGLNAGPDAYSEDTNV